MSILNCFIESLCGADMKKVRLISIIVLALTVLGMAVNTFITRFPDWAVRATGILMLLALFAVVFSSMRISGSKERG